MCFSIDKYSWVVEGIVTKIAAYKERCKGCELQHFGFGGGSFLHSFNQPMMMMMMMMIMMMMIIIIIITIMKVR